MRTARTSLGSVLVAAVVATAAGAQQSASIVNTRHNLSTSGPGPFRAQSEERICIFCHAPHRARAMAPLWNREDSRATYLTYSSSTFQGTVAQPNGSTKLCLSCHDGTIALGQVVSLSSEVQMQTGRRFLSSGPALLGTNLADDHPVSFDYATSRGGSSPEYVPPSALVGPVRLDHNGLMQCTSCHDAHNNIHGNFLHLSDRNSALCTTCHRPFEWDTGSHNLSTASWNGQGTNPWPAANYSTVGENGCANCHRPHAAGQAERLLVFAAEEDNCLNCHNGNVSSQNIAIELGKPWRHSPFGTVGVHDPTEDPITMARHSECQDCHDPHAARSGSAVPPGVPGPLTGARGLDSSVRVVDPVTFGYQVCYKCHADNNAGTNYVSRVLEQTNVRLEFQQGNPSFHPIETAGRNPDVPSLMPPYTTASQIACTDCHNSDSSPQFGGSGANGPHGSVHRPLLGANYTTLDNTQESQAAYALCYRCHSRASILNDDSFKEHRKHIVGERAPCSACHDAHGVWAGQGNAINNSHLINFDRTIVSASPREGRLEFVDQGRFRGECTLLCHGEDHRRKGY